METPDDILRKEIATRFSELIDYLGVTAYKLANDLDTSEANISNFKNGKTLPNSLFLSKLLKYNEAINLNWLLSGQGKMVAGQEKVEKLPKKVAAAHLPSVVVTDDKGKEQIVMMDSKAAAGFPQHIADADFYKKLPTLKIPKISNKSGTHICVQIKGDSMQPRLNEHDYVIGRFEADPIDTVNGDICLIVTNEGVICKRVFVKDKVTGDIECISENDAYSPFELKANEYLQIYKYIAHLSFNAQSWKHDLRDIYTLKSRVAAIEKKLKL